MKKRVYGKKLSRGRGSRKALFRSLMKALVQNGSIKTTKAKAKAVQGDIDKLVNIARDGNVAKRRMAFASLANDKETTNKLLNVIAPKFGKISSGYTRIIPLPQRRGDLAEMVRLEWTVNTKENQLKKVAEKDTEKRAKGVAGKLKSVTKNATKKETKSKEKIVKSGSKNKKAGK